MEINDEMIDRLAELAKLEFQDQAREGIRKDLNQMISFVEKLNELDTGDTRPLVYMSDETNVLRTDEVASEISRGDALKNAPQKDSDYFKVPKVK